MEKKKESRIVKILKYLKTFKNITSLEAINMFGETRLSARIYDLKKQGYRFKTESVRVMSRDGWTYVARYTLEG